MALEALRFSRRDRWGGWARARLERLVEQGGLKHAHDNSLYMHMGGGNQEEK